MARPQVADGGTSSNMEGSCEFIEYVVADSRLGVVLQLGGWARCEQLLTVKTHHVATYSYIKHRTGTNTLVRRTFSVPVGKTSKMYVLITYNV